MFKNISKKVGVAILGTFSILAVLVVIFLGIQNQGLKSFISEKNIIPIVNIANLNTSRLEIPVRLKIPKINVDAAIESVGVTTLGEMAVPKGPNDVAWYSMGPRPGETGDAVISGHYGWKNNIPAAFDYLNELRIGDRVYTYDEAGNITTFVVRSLRSYGEKDDATDVFYSKDVVAHLNLITCEGVWNNDTKSYSKRLVVFTDKEE